MSKLLDQEFARAARMAKANVELMKGATIGSGSMAEDCYSPRNMPGTLPIDDGPPRLTGFSCAIVNGGFIVHFDHDRYMPVRPTVAKDVDELIDLIRSAVKRE